MEAQRAVISALGGGALQIDEPGQEPQSAPEPLRGRSVAVAALALLLLLWLKLVPALLGVLIGFAVFGVVWGCQTVRSPRDKAYRSVLAELLLTGVGVALFEAFELLLSASSE